MDPLADSYDSYSPYNYVLNNPLANIDPDGRSVWPGDPEKNTMGLSDERQPDELDNGPGDGKRKPEPKPIQLEEVVVYGKRSSSTVGSARKDALDWAGTALDVTGTGVTFLAKSKMTSLMNQGYIAGTSGLMGATSQSTKSLAGFGSGLGGVATGLGGYVLYEESKQFRNGKMDGGRFGYHLASFGAAVGVGFVYGGAAGGVVGLAAKSGEMAYDISKEAYYTLNGQWNNLVQSLINARAGAK